jgi:hypothetical protein
MRIRGQFRVYWVIEMNYQHLRGRQCDSKLNLHKYSEDPAIYGIHQTQDFQDGSCIDANAIVKTGLRFAKETAWTILRL